MRNVMHLSMKNAQNTMGIRGTLEWSETCGVVGEKAQVILVWVRALGVGNASHRRRLKHQGVAISHT
jgi:hypothetical protein